MQTLLTAFLLSFFGTIGFAFFFNAPKKELIYCGISGALGWTIYIYLTKSGNETVSSNLIATMIVSILGEFLARVLHKPVTAFVIPSIIPLVPGYGLYLTMLYIVQGNYSLAAAKGVETFFNSGAIAVGIIIISSSAKAIKTFRHQ